ncbi:hypothetical protein [Flagellimonas iocasae]|uniref:Uncharacterized protein n=1 Tax=Flagellimonas iocasae TaxID=2055905 RepID=A0ABW4XXT3_9FLAO
MSPAILVGFFYSRMGAERSRSTMVRANRNLSSKKQISQSLRSFQNDNWPVSSCVLVVILSGYHRQKRRIHIALTSRDPITLHQFSLIVVDPIPISEI